MSSDIGNTTVLGWSVDEDGKDYSTGNFSISNGSSYTEFYVSKSDKKRDLKALSILIDELTAFKKECEESL